MRRPVLAVSGAPTPLLGAQAEARREPQANAHLDAPPPPAAGHAPCPSSWARPSLPVPRPRHPFYRHWVCRPTPCWGQDLGELREEWLGAERKLQDLGDPLLRPALGSLFCVGVYTCRCVHVGAAVMCTLYRYMCVQDCVKSHPCRCVHMYTQVRAGMYVLPAFPTAGLISKGWGRTGDSQSGHSLGFCDLVGWHVCATAHSCGSLASVL